VAVGRVFWDFFSKSYASQPVADEDAYQVKLELTRVYLTTDSDVLEYGCGSGLTALSHAPYVRHILGTDYSRRMVQIAKNNAAEQEIDNATFEQAAVEDLSQLEGPFDAVLALNILHLVADWKGAIAESYRLTRPGGVFASSTICLPKLNIGLKLMSGFANVTGLMPRLSPMTQDELIAEIEAVGFEIVERFQPEGGAIFLIGKRPI
tara:strand:- start:8038 stop:8658 length:621 start_codon:yes stop_codon:yes gene_type:complete